MSWFKSNLLMLLAGATAVLAFLLKLSTARSARLKQKADHFRVQAHHAKTVIQKDTEAEVQSDILREEIADEIKRNEIPTAFDPNKLRD